MVRYSLGYNFDPGLAEEVAKLNRSADHGAVVEVYGAVKGGGVGSARPRAKIPALDSGQLADHVAECRRHGLAFNYLLNASGMKGHPELPRQIDQLLSAGVSRLTVATPELAREVRAMASDVEIVLSLVYRAREPRDLELAEAAGVNAVYLDAVTVNRDFAKLQDLMERSRLPFRLYANVSCISKCPVIDAHYRSFAGKSDAQSEVVHNRFHFGCSCVKATHPVEWLQAPWIRPEDIQTYAALGVAQFKLSDRLASSEAILRVAGAYLHGRSPRNLFYLMERDGEKFRDVWADPGSAVVDSASIPAEFVEHFRRGECSETRSCQYCQTVAEAAMQKNGRWPTVSYSPRALEETPRPLRLRV